VLIGKGQEGGSLPGMLEMLYFFILVIGTWIYTYIKINWSICLCALLCVYYISIKEKKKNCPFLGPIQRDLTGMVWGLGIAI
jgi:hypothetical protein